jgi:hypothetical protein
MTAVQRGALLGSLTMLAITLLWSTMAGGTREGTCAWSHACLCHPMPMSTFIFGGLFVGVPAGGLGGALAGALVSRFPRHRRLILMVMAFAAASALEAIVRPFLRCSTDPDALALWMSAVVALVLGALALERSLEVAS